MASARKFEMVLDFMLNLKADKTQVDKVVTELKTGLESIDPKVNIDASELKKSILGIIGEIDKVEKAGKDLDKLFTDIDISFNTEDAKKAIAVIEEQLKDLNNLDLNILEGAFDKLDVSDLDKVQKTLQNLINNSDGSIKVGIELDDKGKPELEKLKNSIAGIESKKAKITLDIKDANSDIADYKEKIENIELKKQKLEIDPEKAESQIKAFQAKLSKLESKKAKLEIDSQQADEQIGKIQTKIIDIGKTTKVNITATGIEKLAQEFENARQEMAQLNDIQKKALAQMKLGGKEGTDEFKKLEAEIEKTETGLKGMAKASGEATDKMTFTDKLQKFGEVSDGIQNMASAIGEVTQPFVQLDTATNRIKTLGGASKEAAPMLREMSLEMSKKVPIGAAAFQTATYDALSAGISSSKADIEAFMDASAKLAVGGGEEIGNTVNLLSSMVNAYGESATKTGEYSDIIFQTVNAGKTTVSELSSSLSNVIPTAAAYGFSLKNVGASLALMTSNGIPTAQATSKLNQLMLEMQKPGAELSAILNKAGVSAESLGSKVKSGDVIGALKDMDNAFKMSGKSATQAFSSAESGAAFNVLTKDFGKLQDTMSGFDSASGSTQKAFEEMAGSLENRTAQLKANIDTLFIGLADSTGIFGELAVVGAQSFQQLSPLITSVVGMKTLFEGIGGSALSFVKTLVTKLVPGLFAQATAQGTVAASAVASGTAQTAAGVAGATAGTAVQLAWWPIIAVMAGIAGAIAGIVALTDWLITTDAERLEGLESQNKALDEQNKLLEKKKADTQTNIDLIKQYEQLGAITNKTAEEQKAFDEVNLKIAKNMPGVISSSKTYGDNLESLKKKSGDLTKELNNTNTEIEKMKEKKIDIDVKIADVKGTQAKDEIMDLLDFNYKDNQELKIKIDKVKLSTNKEDLEKNMQDLKMSIFNSKEFATMDAEDQKAMDDYINQLQVSASTKIDSSTAKMKLDAEKLGKAIAEGSAGGIDSKETQDKIANLATATGKSIDEVTAVVKAKSDEMRSSQFGDVIKSAVEIKKQDVNTEGLDELVDKWKKAGTEAEKASFAEQIKKSAPDAVKFAKTIVDENGKIISVYDVQIDKINQAAQAEKDRLSGDGQKNQEKFIGLIQQEGNEYQSNQGKMEALRAEIESKKKMGVDTTASEEAYDKLLQDNQGYVNELLNNAIQWKESGQDMDVVINQLATSLGKSPEEIKKMIEATEKNKKKQEELNAEANKLAGYFAEASKAANTTFNTALSESISLLLKIKEAKAKGNTEEVKSLQAQLAEKRKQAKEADKTVDQYNAMEKSEKSLYEAKVAQKSAQESLYEQAKKQFDLEKKKNDNELKSYQNVIKKQQVEQKREKTAQDELLLANKSLQIADENLKKYVEILKQKGLVNGINDNGELEFAKKNAKDTEKAEEEKQKKLKALAKEYESGKIKDYEEYARRFDEINNLDVSLVAKGPEQTEIATLFEDLQSDVLDRTASLNSIDIKAKLDKSEFEKALFDFEVSKIEYDMEIGIRPKGDYSEIVGMYKELGVKLQNELDAINADVGGEDRDKKLLAKEKEILENKKTIWGYDLKELQTKYDKENKLRGKDTENYNAKLEKDLAITQKFIDTWSKSSTKKMDTDYTSDIDGLDSSLEEQKKLLEKSKEEGYLTEEAYAVEIDALQDEFDGKKRDREEKYRRDKLRLENVNAGLLEEQERQTAVAKLEREKADLMEQIKQAVAMGDTNKADELKAQLDETEKILKEKGDVLAQLANGMGGAVSDSIASMFAGDEEGAVDSMRAYFARLAGELKGLLSAFVLKMVLSKGVTDYLTALPFPLNIAAIPIVTGLVNAGVSAIADPIINELLSFASGGRLPVGVYNKPTAIMVGDGAKLGGANTETVLRDEHILGLVKMANGGGNSAMLNRLASIENLLASQEIFTDIKGTDLRLSQRRTGIRVSNRAR